MKKEKRKLIKDRKFDNLKIRMEKFMFCQDLNHNGKTKSIYNRAPMTTAVKRFCEMFGTENCIMNAMRNNNDTAYDRYDRRHAIWPELNRTNDHPVVKLSPTQIMVYFKCQAPRSLVNSRLGKLFQIENGIIENGIKVWHYPPMQYQSRVTITCPDVEAINGERVLFKKKTDKTIIIPQEDTKQKNINLLVQMSKREPEENAPLVFDIETIIPGMSQLQALDQARGAANQLVNQMEALLELEIAKRDKAEYEYNQVLTKLQPKISMLSALIDPYTFKEA